MRIVKYFSLMVLVGLLLVGKTTRADEGMWLWSLINKNISEMQRLGLKLSAEDIYDVNNSSLKDAVVSLRFCTAEIISPEGLMLTNHHCSYGAIQSHSTKEHNYLDDGFWARNKQEELQTDITASILVRMEDITDRMINAGDEAAEEQDIIEEATEGNTYEAEIVPMFEGNQYFLFVYEVFKDVRLVGAPPSSIGKFGGDTDNWMWPRHTGDFSMLRIYMSPEGEPAEYAENNIPYKPKHFFPISIKGYDKGDFAMVMGFPGSTQRYKSSFGIAMDQSQSNPDRIKLREKRLGLMKEDMDRDESIRIQYAAKYSQISNYYKYFIGQNEGLNRLHTVELKKKQEKEFTNWLNKNPKMKEKYWQAIPMIEEGYKQMATYNQFYNYLVEGAIGSEIMEFSLAFRRLNSALSAEDVDETAVKAMAESLKPMVEAHFKDYNRPTDIKVTAAMLDYMYNDLPANMRPQALNEAAAKAKGDWLKYTEKRIFGKSFLDEKETVMEFLEDPSAKDLEKDAAFGMMMDILNYYFENVQIPLRAAREKITEGDKLFIAGLMEMKADQLFYPDANSTPRLTYGTVRDYIARDAVKYLHYTTSEGILQKEDDSDPEFVVPDKLVTMLEKKDFGRYGEDGKLMINFITDNDITGGNSGSPVINAEGHLIGTAFDGNWEAMTGDLVFDTDLKRCINVDVRYTLFIIDKYANAQNLIKEMKIVE